MPRPPSQDRRQRANRHKSASWVQHATCGPQIADKWITPLIIAASVTSLTANFTLGDPWHAIAGLCAIYALFATPWIPNDTKES